MMMVITAKYSGYCAECGERIERGERIEWTRSNRATSHVECPQEILAERKAKGELRARDRKLRQTLPEWLVPGVKVKGLYKGDTPYRGTVEHIRVHESASAFTNDWYYEIRVDTDETFEFMGAQQPFRSILISRSALPGGDTIERDCSTLD